MKNIFVVYLTVNVKNKKMYIGSHRILNQNFDDGYLGSGAILNNAIKKYGKENFIRIDLEKFHNEIECRNFETILLESLNVKNDKKYYNVKNSAIGFNSKEASEHWNNYYNSELYSKERKKQKSDNAKKLNMSEKAAFKNSEIQKELGARGNKVRKQNILNNPEKYSEFGRRGANALTKEQRAKGGKTAGKKNAESGHLKNIASAGGLATKGMKWYTNISTGIQKRFRDSDLPKDGMWIRGRKNVNI